MHPDRLLLFLILNETAIITQRLDSIVSDQDQLNADVAEENTLLSTMENEITSLKAQPKAAGLDFSGVDSLLTRFRGDATSATPADPGTPAAPSGDALAPAPSDIPATPVDNTSPPAPSADAPGSIPAAPPTDATPPADTTQAPPAPTLYTYDGDPSTVDRAQWPLAGTTPDGKPLFTYAGTPAPGDTGPWHVYTPPTA